MLDIVFYVLLGAFIGWHFPEPWWAKALKEKVLEMINKPKE